MSSLKCLSQILTNAGYRVRSAGDGELALLSIEAEQPNLILLDFNLPGINGVEVCRRLKADPETSGIPIIFISAKSEEVDKVIGLELGADDYIVKPFGIREVVARVRAVTRRYLAETRDASLSGEAFVMGDIEVFPDELRARRGDRTIDLSLRDTKILKILHANRGKVVDRYALFQEAWELEHVPNSRTLDQHVSQLRKRIERDPKDPRIIATVHGVGYRYDG